MSNNISTTFFFDLGNIRYDSPGHSAQYCSYTIMELTAKIFNLKNTGQKINGPKINKHGESWIRTGHPGID